MEPHFIFSFPPYQVANDKGQVPLRCPACHKKLGETDQIGGSVLRAVRTPGSFPGGCCSAAKGRHYVFAVWRGTRPTFSPAGRPEYLADGARSLEQCVYVEAFSILDRE